MKIWFIEISLLLLVADVYANIENGKIVYDVHCKTCHSIDMTGGEGGDFNPISYSRTKEELYRYTSDPLSEYKNFGFSASAMPNIPLKIEDIEDVVEYVDSLQPFKRWMKYK